jgi:2-phospho-L-lactate/phosphoenolpyruvate guanylyltransferase
VSSRPHPEAGWSVVLPFKGGPAAKSRLGPLRGLATAIALDCLDAVLALPTLAAVIVVTPDDRLAAAARAAGARVRPESSPGRGLAGAVTDGLRDVPGPCAVLLGDLPALRADDLGTALGRARELLTARGGPPMVFVPDAEGTGTVLLAALDAAAMTPSFGPASAAAHERAGALRLAPDLPRLRRDVDTPADLEAALALGAGPRTTSVAAAMAVMGPIAVTVSGSGRSG